MRFIGTALVFALLASAPLASAQRAIDITPSYIAGIQIGMTKAKALSLMTKPLRHDLLEDGYERYVSSKQKVEVYFRKGVKGVDVVTTWNKQFVTDVPVISPCSTVAALKAAYKGRLKPWHEGSSIPAYRLGNLVFTAYRGRIGAIGLGRGDAATYVTLNVTPCK